MISLNSKTEKLLSLAPYSIPEIQKNILFKEALIEELIFHYNNNELYKKFCIRKDFDPRVFDGDLSDIPPIAVSVFKELGNSLGSVSNEEIKLSLQSSATSGIPSTVLLDKITAKRQAKAMVKVVQEFIGKERKHLIICDIKPKTENLVFMGARFAAIGGYLNFAMSSEYILDTNENGKLSFDIETFKNHIKELPPNQPIVVFGFTYILFSEILKKLIDKNINLKLPVNSKLIHIGGWKKLESEKITKESFNELTESVFGISKENVIDIYGFTEQMGLNYPDCKCGYKHAPVYSEVIVRDPITREVVSSNKEGILEFLSPIPHSYPGNVVLTDDLGFINKEKCPYGLLGTRFKINGRLKKAEIRGCGDVLASKYTDYENISINTHLHNKKLKIISHYHSIDQFCSNEQILEQITNSLKAESSWLRKQPIDALIGLIGKVAEKWEKSTSGLDDMKNNGLSFLANWCSPEHLNRLSTIGLRNNRYHIEQFISLNDSRKEYLKANQRGLVCHWLAGNVQILGMFALVQSILTKNVNLLKISSRDEGVFERLIQCFVDTEFETIGGHRIRGNDLLKTISIIYYDHQDYDLGKIMSKNANVRIAWGGKEAVETVASYPKKFDTEDIIFGPKVSYSVIANEMLENERSARKVARKIAVDASIFDQTGCASPHNVFVEEGGNISPLQFASYLSESMEKVSLQIPKSEASIEQISNVHSIRGVYDFKGKVWASSDTTWTILFDEDNFLANPVYSRVLTLHSVKQINDALEFINENIQTIGLAAKGSKALSFAESASELGVMRCPEIGKMLNFESPWDGIILMDRLVRWSTFGGPII
jgi:hypothetical protein